MNLSRRQRSAALLAVATSLVTAACGGGSDPLDLGFKRVSLDLVFKDATKADPELSERQVITIVEYFNQEFGPAAFDELPEEEPRRRIPRVAPRVDLPVCLEADPNETPEIPALSALHDPPKEGTYRRRNVGSIHLLAPPLLDATLPYPPFTRWTITDIAADIGTVATNPRDDDELPLERVPRSPDPTRADPILAPVVHRFTLTRNITSDSRQVDTYQYVGERGTANLDSTEYDGDGLYLVKRETFSARFGNTVFEPTPPIMVTAIGDEHEVQEVKTTSGVDRRTGAAMTIHSKIVGREDIDVCGEVVGTYRVEFDEVFVDMTGGVPSPSGTVETQKKNVWNITFNRGLHIVREEIHRIDRRNVDGVPVQLTFNYVSTLMNMEPAPLEED